MFCCFDQTLVGMIWLFDVRILISLYIVKSLVVWSLVYPDYITKYCDHVTDCHESLNSINFINQTTIVSNPFPAPASPPPRVASIKSPRYPRDRIRQEECRISSRYRWVEPHSGHLELKYSPTNNLSWVFLLKLSNNGLFLVYTSSVGVGHISRRISQYTVYIFILN